MNRNVIKVAVVMSALAIGGFLVSLSGLVPVKASSGHWPLTEWFLQFSMRRSIATHSVGLKAPELSDASMILKGATHYDVSCLPCHGGPGQHPQGVLKHMLPTPPPLSEITRERSAEELFYVVKHGLKFTGMPPWPAQDRDDEVWAMVAFLKKLPDLDESAYLALARGSAELTHKSYVAAEKVPDALQVCVACHGADGLGRGNSAFPILAGQRTDYLRQALEAYARGERHSGIMQPVAAELDEKNIEPLVQYFTGLRAAAPQKISVENVAIARGKDIALNGIKSQRIPACVECHGAEGRRMNPAYPALHGQRAEYLLLQLKLFHENRRGGGSYAHLMQPVAAKLTSEQMRDLALYFESLPALPEGKN
jgi:cytochrome c553